MTNSEIKCDKHTRRESIKNKLNAVRSVFGIDGKRLFFCLTISTAVGILIFVSICVIQSISPYFNMLNLSGVEYEHRAINVLKLLGPKKLVGVNLIRLGNPDGDGGYVMLDEFPSDSIAYSFGLGDDVSLDADLAKKNIDIYMYDNTIDALPFYNDHFHFFKMGICGKINNDEQFETFEQLLKTNGHANHRNIILKMDVEGAEWESLICIPQEVMEQCNQIIVEFHGLEQITNFERYRSICNLLEKINNTHQSVHLHGNNFSRYPVIGGKPIPNVIEVTYARKKNHKFTKNYACYPIDGLDKPNTPLRAEYFLGFCGMLNE
jgi:hypothetical protein